MCIRDREYAQALLYQYLVIFIDLMGTYFTVGSGAQQEECLKRIRGLVKVFDMERLVPHKLASVYYGAMVHYATIRNEEKVIENFIAYVHLIEREWKNFSIHGDKFFDRLENWVGETGLNTEMPRDRRLVRKDLVEGVVNSPVFDAMRGNPEFHKLENRLKNLADEPND